MIYFVNKNLRLLSSNVRYLCSAKSDRYFDKILIANRGEIACRIIKTAKKMGIKTVAVYSEPDNRSKHVTLSDESICIGPAPATESYLKMDNILDAIKRTGAQAVHPGYGFLSENATFVQLLEKENITFIGPSAEVIQKMGDKLQSKKLAISAGVNTIPGHDGVVENEEQCVEIARKIGYPVMIKASAGGGGKGMRIAWKEDDVSTFFDENIREKMGSQATMLCNVLGYSSAGTVEFLVDENRNFYFLEMNTRLQVEHPVTELITGVDLVEQMIRIAAGRKLNFEQKDVTLNGWAVESRIYAEDPFKNFGMPSVGKINKYFEPNVKDVRFDSGVTVGSDINVYYDPLLCKLISYGQTRKEAIDKSIEALDRYVIQGVTNNVPLLRNILTESKFQNGDLSTNYLTETYPEGFKGHNLNKIERNELISFASAVYAFLENRNRCLTPDNLINTWDIVINIQDEKYSAKVNKKDKYYEIQIEDDVFKIHNNFNIASPLIETNINDENCIFQLLSKDGTGNYEIIYKGSTFKVNITPQHVAKYLVYMQNRPKPKAPKLLKAPMPGLIKSVTCIPGDNIVTGQEICVLEAMKMQNFICSQSDGIVKAINIKEGDIVGNNEVLVEFE